VAALSKAAPAIISVVAICRDEQSGAGSHGTSFAFWPVIAEQLM
jgi:hypothetical protein